MILLDTNVVSNVMKKQPNLQVSLWLDSQPSRGLYMPTITIAEIYYGLNLLPKGKQTTQLTQLFEQFVSGGFVGNILDFDEEAAVVYAQIKATRQQQGRPMSMADASVHDNF
jgi:predicted nucleic acid-binding protein